MTLVDTSVWVDHFRRGNTSLRDLLGANEVVMHPIVIGELACGHVARRNETLRLLHTLPQISQAPDDVVMQTIENRKLWGKGIGGIDAHLLVASLLSEVTFWTLDRRLATLF